MKPIPNFTKVKTIKDYGDHKEITTVAVRNNEVKHVKQDLEQTIQTSRSTLAADVIRCLKTLTFNESKELTLRIITDKHTGEPSFIYKSWVVQREEYGR